MKIAVYPGSFDPWHEGHEDILVKALAVFDQVIVAQGVNPDKKITEVNLPVSLLSKYPGRVRRAKYTTLLVDFVKSMKADAVIRGLRNIKDFEEEKVQQYWNESLGLTVPTVYFICDKSLVHISSSAIKTVEKFK